MYSTVGNLNRFLDSVSPNPPSHYLHKSCVDDLSSLWEPLSKDVVEYYNLGDLWNCYEEWSAYGVGTNVVLNRGDRVTQYYVPYLSAIQIYTSKFVAASRIPRQDTDVVEFESDSWSDDSTSDKLSRSLSNNSSRTWDATSDDSNSYHDGSWPLKDNKFGYRYLQYFEISSPYWRVPFFDKITELSQHYPKLMTLRSVDLAPASWMAVAWYPIYHIPSKQNDDLSACFLTYHTLSSSFLDSDIEYYNNNSKEESCCSKEVKEKEISAVKISLSPFGLATYKTQGDLWVKTGTQEHENMENRNSAASSWLKQLEIEHHDFNFFKFHTAV